MNEELRDEIGEILTECIPLYTTCPDCGAVFDLTEIKWDDLVRRLFNLCEKMEYQTLRELS